MRPAYGGGGYYGGGAGVPYSAGARTGRGLSPGLLLLPVVALALLPGLWLYSVYPYYYTSPWRYVNQTYQDAQNRAQRAINETKPVICLCQEYSVCGCEENNDANYIQSILGNGSYAALNKTLVNVADVNGTSTIIINGTLPNGTTAAGGSDDDAAAASAAVPQFMVKGSIVYLMGLFGLYALLFI